MDMICCFMMINLIGYNSYYNNGEWNSYFKND